MIFGKKQKPEDGSKKEMGPRSTWKTVFNSEKGISYICSENTHTQHYTSVLQHQKFKILYICIILLIKTVKQNSQAQIFWIFLLVSQICILFPHIFQPSDLGTWFSLELFSCWGSPKFLSDSQFCELLSVLSPFLKDLSYLLHQRHCLKAEIHLGQLIYPSLYHQKSRPQASRKRRAQLTVNDMLS